MSHLTEIQGSIITSLDRLKDACVYLGKNKNGLFQYITGEQARYYSGQKRTCDAVIRFDGCQFDIAVVKKDELAEIEDDNGSRYKTTQWGLYADLWGKEGQKLVDHCGSNFSRLHAEYEAQKAIHTASRRGHRYSRQAVSPGVETITIEL